VAWVTPIFSIDASSLNLDTTNLVVYDSFSVGSSSLSINDSDIEDPCDINLELEVPGAQTILEYYEGSWNGISCEQVDSFCDGTPTLQWT
jgi:hypothetical protein